MTRAWSIPLHIIEFYVFLNFQLRQVSILFDTLFICPEGTLGPISHQNSSCYQLQVSARLGKPKDTCYTAAAAAVTDAARDRGGRLAAVGLSLLWATISPGTIAMVECGLGIIHSWSPTRVSALTETSSTVTGLVSESYEYTVHKPRIYQHTSNEISCIYHIHTWLIDILGILVYII